MLERINFILLIEFVMVTVTAIFLVQPEFIFSAQSESFRRHVSWFGVFLLGLTFCWSVILGITFGLNGLLYSL